MHGHNTASKTLRLCRIARRPASYASSMERQPSPVPPSMQCTPTALVCHGLLLTVCHREAWQVDLHDSFKMYSSEPAVVDGTVSVPAGTRSIRCSCVSGRQNRSRRSLSSSFSPLSSIAEVRTSQPLPLRLPNPPVSGVFTENRRQQQQQQWPSLFTPTPSPLRARIRGGHWVPEAPFCHHIMSKCVVW